MTPTRLLVADDDNDILLLVATRLRRDGYEIIEARDGDEALRLLREHVPAVAVLDIGMPDSTGSRCCARSARATSSPTSASSCSPQRRRSRTCGAATPPARTGT